MLRVLVVLVALTGIARADVASKARTMTETVNARYDDKITHRNPLLKLYDLVDSSQLDNVKHAHDHLLEAKAAFDSAVKNDSDFEQNQKLGELEHEVKAVDEHIDTYVEASHATMWKMVGGLVFLGLAVFGGAILAVIRRRRR